MTKGRISPELAAILRNRDARNRLRHAIEKGEDLTVRIGETTYRISTSNQRSRVVSGETKESKNSSVPQK
jgi:hypothetical protein